jgi:ethanolamine utilization protein EutN
MELAKVVGNVVATVKIDNLGAGKLLLVRSIDENGKFSGNPQVALDTIGAGEEEIVLLVRGSSARFSLDNRSSVDLNIVGIIDNIRSNGKEIYSKSSFEEKDH